MNLELDCIPCIVNSFIKLLKLEELPHRIQEETMRKFLRLIAEADYHKSPPILGREMHRMIREQLNNDDPYEDIKKKNNKMMLDMYTEFEEMIERSSNPFDTAMRLAIAGNVIDFGPQNQFDIMDSIERIAHSPLAIDDSKFLEKDLKKASSLLYIGDNCGEIILDKLFLETINFQNTYFAVRSGPVINDATIEDAVMVGIDKIAKVISTGDDAPGVALDSCSDEFKEIFQKSDVIISKGQGNLEGLIDVDQNIYFLLVTKCDLVGNLVGTAKGDFVVKRSPYRMEDKMVFEFQ
jgi:uncharacterized protein with ATP-grasp and redox domains